MAGFLSGTTPNATINLSLRGDVEQASMLENVEHAHVSVRTLTWGFEPSFCDPAAQMLGRPRAKIQPDIRTSAALHTDVAPVGD